MNRIYKNLIKSFLFGILIIWGVLFVFLEIMRFGGEYAGIAIIGLAIISTIIYCTYTIIDTIKEYCSK
ncbi:MAG: hypothetical protein E7E64_04405 [Clostridium celatum]|nr:hypothetical protein [Clostridium celatum]MDU4979286.1 hypothetical protein [Clostridium celatum]